MLATPSPPPLRPLVPVVATIAMLVLGGCGGGSESSRNGSTASQTGTPAASATNSPTVAPSSGKSSVQIKVRAITPGEHPGKPGKKARIPESGTAQVLIYPSHAAPGDSLEIRIPDLAGGRSRVTAQLVRDSEPITRDSATLTASASGARIGVVRYVCLVPPSATYCPIHASHDTGAFVLRTPHLKSTAPLTIVLVLASDRP